MWNASKNPFSITHSDKLDIADYIWSAAKALELFFVCNFILFFWYIKDLNYKFRCKCVVDMTIPAVTACNAQTHKLEWSHVTRPSSQMPCRAADSVFLCLHPECMLYSLKQILHNVSNRMNSWIQSKVGQDRQSLVEFNSNLPNCNAL